MFLLCKTHSFFKEGMLWVFYAYVVKMCFMRLCVLLAVLARQDMLVNENFNFNEFLLVK